MQGTAHAEAKKEKSECRLIYHRKGNIYAV